MLVECTLSTLEGNDPPPTPTLKSLGWYGGPIKTGTGARSKSTALEHKIWEASKEPRQKGSLAILEPSASVAEVKGDHQSSWQGESHFSAEMWWLDSREDGRVADGGCRDVGLSSQCIPLLCVSQQQHPLELLVNNDDLTRRRGLTNTDNSYFPFARAVMGSYFSLSGFCSSANCEQVCSERAAPHAAFCPNSEIIHRTVRGRETKTHSRDLLGQKKSVDLTTGPWVQTEEDRGRLLICSQHILILEATNISAMAAWKHRLWPSLQPMRSKWQLP